MSIFQQKCKDFVYGRWFESFIIIVILVNSILIGVQTTFTNSIISSIQSAILYIFTFEIILRYIAAQNTREFLNDGWNIFDLSLVIIGWIPPTMVNNASVVMALRVLRVFRVLRLLRTFDEVKLIIAVLLRSLKSLGYNGILFLIFMYLFAVAGVAMFRLPTEDSLSSERLAAYEKLLTEAPHCPANSPDPFENLGEAFFTLFRVLTGEDWTDLRYNLITAYNYDLIVASPSVITIYFVIWFCMSAFLLLNLVTGAVINNYQIAIKEAREQEQLSESEE